MDPVLEIYSFSVVIGILKNVDALRKVASPSVQRIEITAPADGLPQEVTLTASLKGLEEATWQEFGTQAGESSSTIAASERQGQSLILYADDILRNAMVVDLEHTIKKILAKQNILTGGKVILYARDARNAAILEKMIKHADPGIATIIITQEQLQAGGDEVKEADALLRIARAKGARDMLGLIKGPTSQPEDLAAFAKGANLPIVIVGPEEGIYSFAQAISMAMDAKIHGGATNGWLMMLPPIRALTDDIRKQYEQYQSSLIALVAA